MCSGLMGASSLTPSRSFFLPRSFPRHTLTGPSWVVQPSEDTKQTPVTVRLLYLTERSPKIPPDERTITTFHAELVDNEANWNKSRWMLLFCGCFYFVCFSLCFLCCVCVCFSLLGIIVHTRTHQVPQAPEPAAFSVFPSEFSRVSCVPCGFFFSLWILLAGLYIFRSSST